MKYKDKEKLFNFIMINIFYIVVIVTLGIKLSNANDTIDECNYQLNLYEIALGDR